MVINMDIPYILFVDDFPRTEVDSDASLKAYFLKNRSHLEAWAKDRRAPTLQKLSAGILEYYDDHPEIYKELEPKEFKYSDAFDKAVATGDYSEWHELKLKGGTELEQAKTKYDEENPESKDRIRKKVAEIFWEVGFISKLDSGTLPPLTKEPDEDPDITQ